MKRRSVSHFTMDKSKNKKSVGNTGVRVEGTVKKKKKITYPRGRFCHPTFELSLIEICDLDKNQYTTPTTMCIFMEFKNWQRRN